MDVLPELTKPRARAATVFVHQQGSPDVRLPLPLSTTDPNDTALRTLPGAAMAEVPFPHTRARGAKGLKRTVRAWVALVRLPPHGVFRIAYVPHRTEAGTFTLSAARRGPGAVFRAFQPNNTISASVRKWERVAERVHARRTPLRLLADAAVLASRC